VVSRVYGRLSCCRDIDRALAKGAEGAAQLTLRSWITGSRSCITDF
jgi:hypothetical protein